MPCGSGRWIPSPIPRRCWTAKALRAGLGDWLSGNTVMKRTFRNVAIIAGLIQRNMPGGRKSGKQATFSSDILYDTLRRYDPDHLLLRITADEARRGLVDFDRIEEMLDHAPHRDHRMLDRVTHRKQLREDLISILRMLTGQSAPVVADLPPPGVLPSALPDTPAENPPLVPATAEPEAVAARD